MGRAKASSEEGKKEGRRRRHSGRQERRKESRAIVGQSFSRLGRGGLVLIFLIIGQRFRLPVVVQQ